MATFECLLYTRLCNKYFIKLISFILHIMNSDIHALYLLAQFVIKSQSLSLQTSQLYLLLLEPKKVKIIPLVIIDLGVKKKN